MFREVRRKKNALPKEAAVELLKNEKRGVLSLLDEDGYPYGVPLNHWYCEEDGKLYFHGGKTGHRIDAARFHDKASFCVFDSGFHEEGDWALTFRSAVVFGRLEFVEDHEKALEISRLLSYKFTQDESVIEEEVLRSGPATLVIALVPEHITCKRIREA